MLCVHKIFIKDLLNEFCFAENITRNNFAKSVSRVVLPNNFYDSPKAFPLDGKIIQFSSRCRSLFYWVCGCSHCFWWVKGWKNRDLQHVIAINMIFMICGNLKIKTKSLLRSAFLRFWNFPLTVLRETTQRSIISEVLKVPTVLEFQEFHFMFLWKLELIFCS